MSPLRKFLTCSLLPALSLSILACSVSPEPVRTLHQHHALAHSPGQIDSQRLDHSHTSSFREIPYAGAPDGLSGLARDPDGKLWAVSETSHQLVMLDLLSNMPSRTLDIHGVPAGLELESIAFLDDGRLVIGTESEDADRASDLVLVADRVTRSGNDRFEVSSTLDVPYELWNLRSSSDEGIEAICAANGLLVVASETVMEDDQGRTAPLGIYDLARGTWRAGRLPLTSARGKISGLACRARSGDVAELEFIAIERHFKVRRGLHFTLADDVARATGKPLTVSPSVFFDISRGSADNLEGIEWLGPDIGSMPGNEMEHRSIAMITDNYFRSKRSGMGKLLMVAQDVRSSNTAE